MAKKQFETDKKDWLEITMSEAIDFLEENGTTEEKKEFKKWLNTTKDGKKSKNINWGNAKARFVEKYCPNLKPEPKEKEAKISDRIANW